MPAHSNKSLEEKGGFDIWVKLRHLVPIRCRSLLLKWKQFEGKLNNIEIFLQLMNNAYYLLPDARFSDDELIARWDV